MPAGVREILNRCHSEPSVAEGEDVPRNLLYSIGIFLQSRGKERRRKFAPIPKTGSGAKSVNLCAKTVVKLGEKKAYDEPPAGGEK